MQLEPSILIIINMPSSNSTMKKSSSSKVSKVIRKKAVMPKPCAAAKKKVVKQESRLYQKTGKFSKKWKSDIKDIPKYQLLTALQELLEDQPASYQQCARLNHIRILLDMGVSAEADIIPDMSTTELVEKWKGQIADVNRAPSLDQLVRAVLVCVDNSMKKNRSIITTRQLPSKSNWSRTKKDVTTTSALHICTGKRPPVGTGSYPKLARTAQGQIPGLKNQSMRNLYNMSKTFGPSAVAYACKKFIQDNPEVDCTMTQLSKYDWFAEYAEMTFAPPILKRGSHLLSLWKDMLNKNEINAAMVMRAVVLVLRPIEVRDKTCGMCSCKLDPGDLMRRDDWNPCKHHFCNNCLAGRALSNDGGCRLCAIAQSKRLRCSIQRATKDFKVLVHEYWKELTCFVKLHQFAKANPMAPERKTHVTLVDAVEDPNQQSGTPCDEPVSLAGQSTSEDKVVNPSASEDEEEFSNVCWKDAEVVAPIDPHTMKHSVWVIKETDDSRDARRIHSNKMAQLEESRALKVELEGKMLTLLNNCKELKTSLPYRAIATFHKDKLAHVPQDLYPDYVCNCSRRVCICHRSRSDHQQQDDSADKDALCDSLEIDVDQNLDDHDDDDESLYDSLQMDLAKQQDDSADKDTSCDSLETDVDQARKDRLLVLDMKAKVNELKKEIGLLLLQREHSHGHDDATHEQ